MKEKLIGKAVIRIPTAGSTNDLLLKIMQEKDTGEGTLVIASKQVAGKGQRGNSWETEPGMNLTFSFCLYPEFLSPDRQFLLNKAVSVGIARFVASVAPPGRAVRVKWPNDILLDGQKVAGVLIENSISQGKILHSVVGIGLNVNQEHFPGLPDAASLRNFTGSELPLENCLSALCVQLDMNYHLLRKDPGQLDAAYLAQLHLLGEWSEYEHAGERIKARISGVSPSGELMLEGEQGAMFRAAFKEIRFLK